MRRIGLLWAVVAVIVLPPVIGGCSKTEGTGAVSEQPKGPTGGAVGSGGAGANLRSDDAFVRDVALKNIAEIELSRIAVGKATNPDIKSFAQRMLDDHGAAADKLKSIVAGQIEWPDQLDEKQRKNATELGNKQSADFDREYAKAMVDGHQDLAAKLESRLDVQSLAQWKTAAAGRTQSRALSEPDVALRDVQVRPDTSDSPFTMKINQWAADTYPVTQKHLDTVRMLEIATKDGRRSRGLDSPP